jgi:hypothetical protein
MKMALIAALAIVAGFTLIYAPIALQGHIGSLQYTPAQNAQSTVNGQGNTSTQAGSDMNTSTAVPGSVAQPSSPQELFGGPLVIAVVGLSAAICIYLVARRGVPRK